MGEVSAGAGRRLADRYTLRAPIGEGGVGVVWCADDELLGRAVAVKEIHAADGDGDPVRARIMRETRAAARLNHPGVVTIHQVLQAGDALFIVMELLTAPSLARLVETDGPLTAVRTARIGLRILDVLEAAHRRGIVHRDVKPSNVMLLAGDLVKLTDFGIGGTLGYTPPEYTPPEQASGEAIGPAADLWALGVTLYFAVEGRPPSAPAPGSGAGAAPSGRLEPVLQSLLATSPEARPTHNVIRRELEAVAAETVVGGWPPRRWRQFGRI